MVGFHLAAVQHQLQQAYVGLALAVAVRRAFILPQARAARHRQPLLCGRCPPAARRLPASRRLWLSRFLSPLPL